MFAFSHSSGARSVISEGAGKEEAGKNVKEDSSAARLLDKTALLT